MPQTLIIADDLSGAADCAVAFAGDALVALGDTDIDAATLAIDADTRRGDARNAAETTHRLFARHAKPNMLLFKKLDSTLRGHIGVEIAAARDALAACAPLVIVAPSYPATGRTLRDGRLRIHGVPLADTEIAREIEGPTTLLEMLGAANLAPTLIDLAAMRGDINAAMTRGDVLVCDAETETDLHAIAAAGKNLGRNILWAGSGGLARVLGQGASGKLDLPPIDGSILFLIGSRSEISHAQARHLAAAPNVTLVTIAPATLKSGDATLPAISQDSVVMLESGAHDNPAALVQAFAALVAPAAAKAGALFLTGGETAHAVLTALGVSGLRLQGEIAPGVIVSRAEGGVLAGRIIVTKAGAFGGPEALGRVRAVLRGRSTSLE